VVKDMSIAGVVAISDPRDRGPIHICGEAISNKQACNVACILSTPGFLSAFSSPPLLPRLSWPCLLALAPPSSGIVGLRRSFSWPCLLALDESESVDICGRQHG
jgi:hypothetical protein